MLDVILQRPGLFGLTSPAPMSRYDIDGIAKALRLSRDVTHNIRHGGRIRPMPSRDVLEAIVADLSAALFPSHYSQSESGAEAFDGFVCGTLSTALGLLEEQVRRGLTFTHEDVLSEDGLDRKALEITRAFAAKLPEIRVLLVQDLRAALETDPAASSAPEILLGYPGMAALIHYRLAHALHQFGSGLPARLVADLARARTGIDIHPAAEIGEGLFIDHGMGVVIGETAILGSQVRLYQGVTLGARAATTATELKGLPRHPIVDDGVVIYAGATVLGRVTIGRGSVIGANVCLTTSVPPNSRIMPASIRRGCGDGQPPGE